MREKTGTPAGAAAAVLLVHPGRIGAVSGGVILPARPAPEEHGGEGRHQQHRAEQCEEKHEARSTPMSAWNLSVEKAQVPTPIERAKPVKTTECPSWQRPADRNPRATCPRGVSPAGPSTGRCRSPRRCRRPRAMTGKVEGLQADLEMNHERFGQLGDDHQREDHANGGAPGAETKSGKAR